MRIQTGWTDGEIFVRSRLFRPVKRFCFLMFLALRVDSTCIYGVCTISVSKASTCGDLVDASGSGEISSLSGFKVFCFTSCQVDKILDLVRI